TLHRLVSDRQNSLLEVVERVYDIARDHACHLMCPRCVLHSRREVDGISIDADGTLCVTLLANDDITAMNADSEGRNDAKLSMILPMLSFDGGEYPVDGAQDLVAANRIVPIP